MDLKQPGCLPAVDDLAHTVTTVLSVEAKVFPFLNLALLPILSRMCI